MRYMIVKATVNNSSVYKYIRTAKKLYGAWIQPIFPDYTQNGEYVFAELYDVNKQQDVETSQTPALFALGWMAWDYIDSAAGKHVIQMFNRTELMLPNFLQIEGLMVRFYTNIATNLNVTLGVLID